jgi:protein O-GlcNAc transferase
VALFNRGSALESFGCVEAAIESYDRALALDPNYVNALNNRSGALIYLRRFSEAKAALERVLTLNPDFTYAYGSLAHCLMHMCDWSRREEIVGRLRDDVLAAKGAIHTMTLIAYIDDPELQLACARNYAAQYLPKTISYDGKAYLHEKIRIAYVSSDFHDHATARLAVELFERHDRERFEVIAISLGPDEPSPMRRRVMAAFDQFHDMRLKSDDEIAALIRALEIDIAIDLKGFTHDSRPGVFARRPAPIQVAYLGFPGTSGAECFDYVLADEIVAPMAMQPYFSEQIVHLSGCYQPNDSKRAMPAAAMSRHEAGLPETGFVFCCFNNNFKIAPAFFYVWMRLLRAIDGAVLWLIDDNADAVANLRKEAAARDVDPARLVFAPRVEPEVHLARHAHADLFLDTLPYGAHTTASDALWMGVPVLTCLGRAFAGRVGASLCRAVGLEDLVMTDLAQYEQAALALARDPARLAAIKARLAADRARHRLFDAERHRRSVEAAFVGMMERQRRGEAPAPFATAD